MLHVDAAVGPVSVMFSGAKEPIAAAGQTAVFGKLAVARQVTAPPETYRRRLLVGRCRDVEIEVCFYPLELQGPPACILLRCALACQRSRPALVIAPVKIEVFGCYFNLRCHLSAIEHRILKVLFPPILI